MIIQFLYENIFFSSHGEDISFQKLFLDENFYVRYIVVNPDEAEEEDKSLTKRVASLYTLGSVSPFSVCYRKNVHRNIVRGGNGNYYQGSGCEASSAPFQIAVVNKKTFLFPCFFKFCNFLGLKNLRQNNLMFKLIRTSE